MIEIIRLVIGVGFIISGLFLFGVATFGLFKMRYVLNRVHCAAITDTLATLCVLVGLMTLNGFNFMSLKLFIVLVFLWLTNPVGTHLVGRTEVITNPNIEQECEVVEL